MIAATEQAFDIDKSVLGLALRSCASALLWLADDVSELAYWIARDENWVKPPVAAPTTDIRPTISRPPSVIFARPAGSAW